MTSLITILTRVAVVSAALATSNVLLAQAGALWTVVRYPLDQSISAALVSPVPPFMVIVTRCSSNTAGRYAAYSVTG